MGSCVSNDSAGKKRKRRSSHSSHQHHPHSGIGYDGSYGGGMTWQEREEERHRQHQTRLEHLLNEQEEIDKIEDDEDRLAEQRKRYRCRGKYVLLEEIPTWDTVVPQLKELPDNTTVSAAEKAKRNNGMFASKNDTVKFLETDLMRRREISEEINAKVAVYRGDITSLEIDAIVNAAKESLLGGGGIDGAIHTAAGELLVHECRPLGGCPTGSTRITRGYNLPAANVLHTVGPVGRGNVELRSCYQTTLELIKEQKLRTVAFCCVSTGIFGFPLVTATHIALQVVRDWLEVEENRNSIDRLIFCVFRDVEVESYERIMPSYFPIAEYPAEFTEFEAVDFAPKATAAAAAPVHPSGSGAITSHLPQEKVPVKKGCCQ